MNEQAWQFKREVQDFWKKEIKRLQVPFFTLTANNLKSTTYPDLPGPLDWQKIAGERKIHVEIGSGHGEVLLANNRMKSIVVGYEIKSRFFRLSQRKTRRRDDIFVYKGSGYESLALHFKNDTISTLYILFPDPWHKKKHARRRPLTEKFFARVAQKLKKGGTIIIATDWQEYSDFIGSEVQKVTKQYEITICPYVPDDYSLPITHYHQKWARKGRSFTAFVLKKLG